MASGASQPADPNGALMKAWTGYQDTDDFKNSLIWATAMKYTDAGSPNFQFDEPANQISDTMREQYAKGSLWSAFMAGFKAAGGDCR